MESGLALLLTLVMVPFQLCRGEQGCGEGGRFQEMNGYKGGHFGGAMRVQGFERLVWGVGSSLIKDLRQRSRALGVSSQTGI